jgi:hypothetical protein
MKNHKFHIYRRPFAAAALPQLSLRPTDEMGLEEFAFLHHALWHRLKYSPVSFRYQLRLLRPYENEAYENVHEIVSKARARLPGFLVYDATFAKLTDCGQKGAYLFVVLESLLNYVGPQAAWTYLRRRERGLGLQSVSELINLASSDELANLVIAFEAACRFQPHEESMIQSRKNLDLELGFLKYLLAMAKDRFIDVLAVSASRVSAARRARLMACYLATADEHEAAVAFLKRLTQLCHKDAKDMERSDANGFVASLLIAFAVSEARRCAKLNMRSIAFMFIYRLLAFSHRDLLKIIIRPFMKISSDLDRIIKMNISYWVESGVLNLQLGEELMRTKS